MNSQNDNDVLLKDLYYNAASPGSFSGVDKLYRAAKLKGANVSRNQIRQWLQKQKTYTQNRFVRRKFPTRRVIVPYIKYMNDVDNAYMTDYTAANDGYKYFLLMINDFSRKVYTRALKSLSGKNITDAFKSIFAQKDFVIPEHVRSDKGSEFKNRTLQTFLKSHNVNHVFTQSPTQAAFAERAISTIKSKLLKHMTSNQSKRWIDQLENVTDAYNNSYHRSIKRAPNMVRKTDEPEIWEILYNAPKIKKQKLRGLKDDTIAKTPFKHKLGDTVIVSAAKTKFDRGYNTKWSEEYFTVTDRSVRQGKPVYKIADLTGENILGSFYPQELQAIIPDENGTYKIEKILKRRKRNGRREVLVHWLGWHRKFNSWIPESSIDNNK